MNEEKNSFNLEQDLGLLGEKPTTGILIILQQLSVWLLKLVCTLPLQYLSFDKSVFSIKIRLLKNSLSEPTGMFTDKVSQPHTLSTGTCSSCSDSCYDMMSIWQVDLSAAADRCLFFPSSSAPAAPIVALWNGPETSFLHVAATLEAND